VLEKIKELRAAAMAIVFFVGVSFTAYNTFAKQSEFIAFKTGYEKEQLMKTVFECKKLYGAQYESAPDEFTAKFCRDAEIKLKTSKE
jgi:hypothetical protein